MFFAKLCFLAPCLMMALAANTSPFTPSKPTITIFYENLCPHSVKFFSENFYKMVVESNLVDTVTLKLNSYGNTNHTKALNGTYSYTCEHGPRECNLNEMHACVIKNEPSVAKILKFVNCSLYEAYYNTSKNPVDDCAETAEINVTSIYECMNTSANAYYYDFSEEFKKFGIDNVPSVAFNNTFNKTLSAEAVNNFPDSACNFLKANNLSNEYCKSKNSAAIPSVSFITFVIASFLLVKMYQ